MHLMTDYRESLTAFRLLPSASNVSLVKPEQQVYGAMMSGWENQQLSRGLRQQTIDSRTAIVSRFHEFIDKPPWKWTVADEDEFTADAAGRSLTLSTLRQNHGAIRTFCDYITSPLYDWMEICDHQFGEVPSQVCLPWNTVAHRFEFEGDGKRRPLSYEEVERLFNTADARVDKLALSGRKGALGALRDAQLLKTIYAFGLRRTEAVMLDTVDLHYSSKMRHWVALWCPSRAVGKSSWRRCTAATYRAPGTRVRLVGSRHAAVERTSSSTFRSRGQPGCAVGDRTTHPSICRVS